MLYYKKSIKPLNRSCEVGKVLCRQREKLHLEECEKRGRLTDR